MSDLSLSLTHTVDSSQPFAAVFAIEQQLFRKCQSKVLNSLEKGAILFSSQQSFEPMAASIDSISEAKDGKHYTINGGLLNLTGPNGILPSHYSEAIAKTLRDKNTVLKDFIDIFNHRANSLMYRSWAKYRLDTDKAYQANVEQYQSAVDLMLSALSGEPYPDAEQSNFYFGGLTYAQTVSAQKLEHMIQSISNLPVRINQFKGKWIELAEEQLSRMSSFNKGESFNQLGVNTMLGRRCWDLNSGFEVEIEIKDAESFERLTPNGDLYKSLKRMIKKKVGSAYDFNFKLKVKEAHCKRVRLRKGGGATKLGASAWMGSNTDHGKTINYYC